MTLPKFNFGLFLGLTVLLLSPPFSAQVHDERAIKVAYVFNLTKYVTWPRGGNQLVVGFVGDGPMGEALQKMLTGRASESRPIRVLLSLEDEELEQCDVLYVAYSSPQKVRATLERLRGKSVLTVGDTESFPRDGGMIGLVRAGEQVRLQVNLEVVQGAGLKISSRVLDLATIVHSNAEANN
jgi:YfiR/HmsC-like